VRDLRLGDAEEERGVLGLVAAGLDAVILVVQPHADDFSGVRDYGKECDFAGLDVGFLRGLGDLLRYSERVAREQAAQVPDISGRGGA